MTRPGHYEAAPPAAWMLPGLQGKAESTDPDAIYGDFLAGQSERVAEKEAEKRGREELEHVKAEALGKLERVLREQLKKKGMPAWATGALSEALVHVKDGDIQGAEDLLIKEFGKHGIHTN